MMQWNDDPEWITYITSKKMELTIKRIAAKYTQDEALREDCEQEARIALLTVFPSSVATNLDAYCRNVIRNSVLSYLSSYRTGNLYIGRTEYVDGKKVHRGPRFASLDELIDDHGMQVDEFGRISFERVNDYSDSDDDVPDVPVATVRDDRDEEIVNHVTLEQAIDRLSDEDRRFVLGHLAGEAPISMQYNDYRIRIIAHRLASLAKLDWRCDECEREKPAAEFGWTNPRECLSCERRNQRYNRSQIERWMRAVEAGEFFHCAYCREDKPATEFPARSAKRCSRCTNAAHRGELIIPDSRQCIDCGQEQPWNEVDRYGRCTECRGYHAA